MSAEVLALGWPESGPLHRSYFYKPKQVQRCCFGRGHRADEVVEDGAPTMKQCWHSYATSKVEPHKVFPKKSPAARVLRRKGRSGRRKVGAESALVAVDLTFQFGKSLPAKGCLTSRCFYRGSIAVAPTRT
mmetsp:Transcript_150722/g.482268  ORF Transcript_150722/g.482268 Transcript_150722/m.482268 type:complete len:131 (-) Transcript_150722:143-535(-)